MNSPWAKHRPSSFYALAPMVTNITGKSGHSHHFLRKTRGNPFFPNPNLPNPLSLRTCPKPQRGEGSVYIRSNSFLSLPPISRRRRRRRLIPPLLFLEHWSVCLYLVSLVRGVGIEDPITTHPLALYSRGGIPPVRFPPAREKREKSKFGTHRSSVSVRPLISYRWIEGRRGRSEGI